MIVRPSNQDDSWFVEDCKMHLWQLWHRKHLCPVTYNLLEPHECIIVEVRNKATHAYVAHVTYDRDIYGTQGDAFDRDDRIVIVWDVRLFIP